jgi:hypothetical protein
VDQPPAVTTALQPAGAVPIRLLRRFRRMSAA